MTNESADRIDIDLSHVDAPFLTLEDGTYTLVLVEIKLDRSSTDRPMLRCRWESQHPETNETVSLFDYPLLDQQQGKFRLRQIIIAKMGGDGARVPALPELVGATAQAEVVKEVSEEYGESSKIKRLLVPVPKSH